MELWGGKFRGASLTRVSEPLVGVTRRRPGSPSHPLLLTAPRSMLLATSSECSSVPADQQHSQKLSPLLLWGFSYVSCPPTPWPLSDFAQRLPAS